MAGVSGNEKLAAQLCFVSASLLVLVAIGAWLYGETSLGLDPFVADVLVLGLLMGAAADVMVAFFLLRRAEGRG